MGEVVGGLNEREMGVDACSHRLSDFQTVMILEMLSNNAHIAQV